MHVGVNSGKPRLVPAARRPFDEPAKPESASFSDVAPSQDPLVPMRSIHDPGPSPAHVCGLLFGKEVRQDDYTRELSATGDVSAAGQQLAR